MTERNYEFAAKVLLIGESGVGKTSLLQRFARNHFATKYLPTIGIDYMVSFCEVEGVRVCLQMWDTAGQEKFNTLTSSFYKSRVTRCRRNIGGLWN